MLSRSKINLLDAYNNDVFTIEKRYENCQGTMNGLFEWI
jgi:hypothetical protein